MSMPGNDPRARRSTTRRGRCEVEATAVLATLCRTDRELLSALVTIVRYGDVDALRAMRVIAGLTLRVARRADRRHMDPMTTGLWRPW